MQLNALAHPRLNYAALYLQNDVVATSSLKFSKIPCLTPEEVGKAPKGAGYDPPANALTTWVHFYGPRDKADNKVAEQMREVRPTHARLPYLNINRRHSSAICAIGRAHGILLSFGNSFGNYFFCFSNCFVLEVG